MLEKNAIVRVLSHYYYLSHYGKDRLREIKSRMLVAHPLDEETDSPIPEWALRILRDQSVGYRTRIRIVLTHHWDITDENPGLRFVSRKDMREAPPRPPPTWLQAHRAKKIELARMYLEKTKKQNQSKGIEVAWK